MEKSEVKRFAFIPFEEKEYMIEMLKDSLKILQELKEILEGIQKTLKGKEQ